LQQHRWQQRLQVCIYVIRTLALVCPPVASGMAALSLCAWRAGL
jgi:hypothetical protein